MINVQQGISNVQVRRFPWLRLCIVQSSNPICSNMRNLLILLLFTGICTVQAQPFKQDIQSFLREDSAKPPAAGQVLFVGSSSFRMWQDVQTYFPTVPIINRGFGGSTLKDVIYYEKQIIAPYKPRKIVIYCGEQRMGTFVRDLTGNRSSPDANDYWNVAAVRFDPSAA